MHGALTVATDESHDPGTERSGGVLEHCFEHGLLRVLAEHGQDICGSVDVLCGAGPDMNGAVG